MKLLWLNQEPGTQTLRVDTLLACFDLSSSREELQAVESPFQALCCVLTYLFVQVTLPRRVHALGAAVGPAPTAPVSGVGTMNTGFLKCSEPDKGLGLGKPVAFCNAPKCDGGSRLLAGEGTRLHSASASQASSLWRTSPVPSRPPSLLWCLFPSRGSRVTVRRPRSALGLTGLRSPPPRRSSSLLGTWI